MSKVIGKYSCQREISPLHNRRQQIHAMEMKFRLEKWSIAGQMSVHSVVFLSDNIRKPLIALQCDFSSFLMPS